ncbi:WD40 repeat-containing protein [Thalassoporum mexicanum PCC 7367]|uniref:WD40 repeat domain-containing protein n=1 Tax=Thalassoporum mexicanum TaxID=3457544 RepID=UPI00029FE270|nr:WD40 repeat domain-containing protein [Pseudanabaena sp. PCC 7367]AFY71469.1 WD40 repeat-containing protein [Pseudanabaena sp. PCC 7367]
MKKQQSRPRDFDSILGGSQRQLLSAAVLGGMAGVWHKLATNDRQQRIIGLQDASKYGSNGLKLVIEALQDVELEPTAYRLLRDRPEPLVKAALANYQPYRLFGCMHELQTDGAKICGLEICGNDRVICICHNYQYSHKFADHQIRGKHIEVWDAATGSLLERESSFPKYLDYKMRSPFRHVSADQKITAIASGEARTILVLGSSDTHQLCGHDAGVYAVAVSEDGQTLVSGCDDGTIKIWDLTTMTEIASLHGHDAKVRAVAVSSDRQLIASGSNDGVIKVWGICA